MVVQTRAHALCSRLRFRLRSGAGGLRRCRGGGCHGGGLIVGRQTPAATRLNWQS